MNAIDKSLADRLVIAVSKKLDAPVGFSHWEKSIYGDVPVFNVPAHLHATARELGLSFQS